MDCLTRYSGISLKPWKSLGYILYNALKNAPCSCVIHCQLGHYVWCYDPGRLMHAIIISYNYHILYTIPWQQLSSSFVQPVNRHHPTRPCNNSPPRVKCHLHRFIIQLCTVHVLNIELSKPMCPSFEQFVVVSLNTSLVNDLILKAYFSEHVIGLTIDFKACVVWDTFLLAELDLVVCEHLMWYGMVW